MTRREFLRRSAPLIAAGTVTPWFVEAVARRLFGPRRYWSLGPACPEADVCLHLPAYPPPGYRIKVKNTGDQPVILYGADRSVGPDETAIVVISCKDPGAWKVEAVSLVTPSPGQKFPVYPVG